jgi:hypothetical protein
LNTDAVAARLAPFGGKMRFVPRQGAIMASPTRC